MIYELSDFDRKPNKLELDLSKTYQSKIIMLNNIPNKHEEFINYAINLAKKSNLSFKHGCVIVRRGKIISRGYNKCELSNTHICSIHAEVNCIANLKKFRNANKNVFNNCSMYVVRINDFISTSKKNKCLWDFRDKECELRNSKPCDICFNHIFKCGIKTIYYSNDF
jgi:tRNA(Arg) A34 adenosine deaminase TadA